MKKLFCFIACLIVVITTTSAQENFIEVVVRDTMMLQPKSWIYTVSLKPTYETPMYSDTTVPVMSLSIPVTSKIDGVPKPKRTTIGEVTILAKKYNGQLSDDGEDLAVNSASDYTMESANYLFTNLQSMKSFVQALTALKDVDGRVIYAWPAEASTAMTALDSKMIATAKKRAENLAAVSGRHLGAITIVTEDFGNGSNSLQTFLEGLFKTELFGKSSRSWTSFNEIVTVSRSLKVRFALL